MRKEDLVVGNIYVTTNTIQPQSAPSVFKGAEFRFIGWRRCYDDRIYDDYKKATENRRYSVSLIFQADGKTFVFEEARYFEDASKASLATSSNTARENRRRNLEQRLASVKSRLSVVSSSVEQLLTEHAELTATEEKLNFQINALKAYKSDDEAIAAMVAELNGQLSPDKIKEIISKFSPI